VIITALLAGVPALLVLVEPDLGSALVIGAVWVGILLVSPISKARLAIVFLILGVMAAVGWRFVLHDYQRNRLEAFLNPNLDPQGQGYNVRQAIVAVGSGQWFGRGLGKGLQSQLKFLPERQTDFIFATASEEIGFVGSSLLVLLYILMLWRIALVARRARDDLGKYLAYGIFFLLFFQVTVNISMNMGLAPVTGIPLPLLSYGGSSLIMTFLALGIVHNISWQSKALRF
jgi:rod shape determining protein RodA